jgi:CarD family transcriptional regulator
MFAFHVFPNVFLRLFCSESDAAYSGGNLQGAAVLRRDRYRDIKTNEETTLGNKLVFKQGDKVVYPAQGVGEIEAIQSRTISGTKQDFFVIRIMETGAKIMVPTHQIDVVGLRKVVGTKMVDEVYKILKDRSVAIDNQTWNRRYREYHQKIKTGSVLEIASVIRDLSVLKGDKELSFGERRMLDTAQGLLVKEISIAKSSPEDTIKAELEELCEIAA